MEEKPYSGFYAKFLGGFSLAFEGRELQLKTNPQGKCMQMLLFLLKSGSAGCEKRLLLELVRPDEKDREKRMNNFRQQIHLMRKLVKTSGLPDGRYVVVQGSRYYFTQDYPLNTDAEGLDDIIRKIRSRPSKGEETQKLYLEYCKTYTGEFLPFLGGEEWVAMESAYYQKWYFDCLNQLCIQLKEQEEYETLLHLCTSASQFHPYDEWQAVQIECLMALNRRKEAEKVYEAAAELFYKDLGLTSLDRVMARYQENTDAYYMARTMSSLKNSLEEYGKAKGPYHCSYPSFVDIYRIIARRGERENEKNLLLLCTLSSGRTDGSEEKKAEQMELFQKVLVHATRAGDIYARYSSCQYLVLLTGASKGTEKLMISRLKSIWEKAGGQAGVEFSVSEVEGAKEACAKADPGAYEKIC
ncbi:MAG: hypothetical protein HFG51_10745 [Lachnospiraceae bacterium]|nr:hypothetical protein [Lachnospiraceae bacterium]